MGSKHCDGELLFAPKIRKNHDKVPFKERLKNKKAKSKNLYMACTYNSLKKVMASIEWKAATFSILKTKVFETSSSLRNVVPSALNLTHINHHTSINFKFDTTPG